MATGKLAADGNVEMEITVTYLGGNNAAEFHVRNEQETVLGSLGVLAIGQGFHPGTISQAMIDAGIPADENGKLKIVYS